MRVAIVTDFLNQLGGAEWVTSQIASLYPEADIYTLMAKNKVLNRYFSNRKVYQHPKFVHSHIRRTYYRKLFPLYPTYIEDFNLNKYDLVISSSYLWAKGVLTRADATHISYIHTPMRQAWVKYHRYLNDENDVGRFSRTALRYLMNYMRLWDAASAKRVDHFIANSTVVQQRIKKFYRREATVIHPPVKIKQLQNENGHDPKEDYYITVGRLVPYKRIDLIIKLFNQLPERKLLIVGEGNDRHRLQTLVDSANIELLGYLSEQRKNKLVAKARGFIFAAEEDFGISPVEAMALGTPVIAYNKGGAQDYIQPGVNGVFFDEQHVASLTSALQHFEKQTFDQVGIKKSVSQFDQAHFLKELKHFVDQCLAGF